MARLVALMAAAMAASLHLMASAAAQQAYPERTVRFILPYGAASASDTTARLFADRLSAKWGKPVVVENRPGGDGIVSMQAFVAANDDHTLWFGPAGASTVLPYQHDTLPIDPYHDLNPIVSVSDVVLAISMPASMHVDTVAQLVALARSEPGKLNAAAASGISDFLLFGFFKNLGLEVAHVPYRDIMQAPGDLAEGRIQVLSSSLAVPQPLAHAGRLKILAVTSKLRAPGEPNIPTAEEAGYPALTFESVGGVFGPRGMPEGLRKSIAADFRAVSTDPAISERLASFGTIMDIRGPAEFAVSIQEQRDKLAALAKTLGIKPAQ
ncbi:MAG: tripartite tricarboxylate transporter substrate binding protein [Xanthobacteraceae bacterium]